MKLSVVAAVAENYAIGRENNLLCHLPADMRMFRTLTTGHTVVMGRRTFESLPKGALPNRRNIVVSRTMPPAEGVEVSPSVDDALRLCRNDGEVFVIGGEALYRAMLPLADTLHITWIRHTFEADRFFPAFGADEWSEVRREDFVADEKNPYDYSFVEYERIRN